MTQTTIPTPPPIPPTLASPPSNQTGHAYPVWQEIDRRIGETYYLTTHAILWNRLLADPIKSEPARRANDRFGRELYLLGRCRPPWEAKRPICPDIYSFPLAERYIYTKLIEDYTQALFNIDCGILDFPYID